MVGSVSTLEMTLNNFDLCPLEDKVYGSKEYSHENLFERSGS